MENLITVRKMELGDVTSTVDIERSCFPMPWTRGTFIAELRDNRLARYYVAEIGGQVVGYGGMWLIIDEAHITNIAVYPDHRGKGVGRRIVEKLIEESKKLNIRKMSLEVRRSNIVAQSLYKKFGFVACGVRPAYYQDNGEDALIMWLEF